MAISYTITVRGDTLMVHATGFDESLDDVQLYGMAIIDACLQSGVTHVLCNELDLAYRLDTFDTYKAAEFIAENASDVVRVAIVSNPAYIEDARFWEDVAVNRGLVVRVFKDVGAAISWLEPSGA